MEGMIALGLGKVLAVLGLVAANGFFVAAEFSLVGVRRSRIDELVAQGHGGAKLLQRALDELDDSLAATQLGVTVSSLGLGWIGETTLARLIEPALDILGTLAAPSAHLVAAGSAFVVITVFHIVLGELVPKSLALLRPERTALWIVRPLRLFLTVSFRSIRSQSSIKGPRTQPTSRPKSAVADHSFKGTPCGTRLPSNWIPRWHDMTAFRTASKVTGFARGEPSMKRNWAPRPMKEYGMLRVPSVSWICSSNRLPMIGFGQCRSRAVRAVVAASV